MASTKEIKRRIKSVKSTKKITKAMELVAASKMRKAVAQTLASRLYAGYSWDLLTSMSGRLEEVKHIFFDGIRAENPRHSGARTLFVLITSNGSLCGGYNAQAIKKAIALMREIKDLESIDIISVGKKGDGAMRRVGRNVVASFTELPAILSLRDITPIASFITSEYKKGIYKEVFVIYTDFISALSQIPKVRQILPISKIELKQAIDEVNTIDQNIPLAITKNQSPYLIEGDTGKLVEMLAEKLVRMQIYQMMLESGASEQSARMVAMKNASEAAGEMIDDLTLVFNKARQAGITQEISEISAGMASVS
ncbi:ATP synthase F1 subunit gamma [Candidatus Nomurabacteria bacterium]|nr:ATP synthase F1 subunit gamma [Candidatus Nomurabacteria bacterium]